MALFLSYILFADFILAGYFFITLCYKRDYKYAENKLFIAVCISSAIWSIGFFGVLTTTDTATAAIYHLIGIAGVLAYLITVQFLLCHLAQTPAGFFRYIKIFCTVGIILYVFILLRKEGVYTLTPLGMNSSFVPGLSKYLYQLYSVISAVNMVILLIHMLRRSTTLRFKTLSKRLLTTEAVVFSGMLCDITLPYFGLSSYIGSSILQFIGVLVMSRTISFVDHSRINISNMSEFIYYSLNVPVMVYDHTFRLQIINDSAYSFLGINKSAPLPKEISTLFQSDAADIFRFDGKSHDSEAVCNNNGRYCTLSVNKIHDSYNDLIGYIIIVTDLTEHKRSVKKLEDAIMEAEYANHAKSIFLANMSHEIRTPMNVIVGFSELLLKMDINDHAKKHVEDILLSSHNLLAIINDILDISKIESGKMEIIADTYYTSNLFNDIILIISSQAKKKGLELKLDINNSIPKALHGDKIRIRSVLINILNNAVKYTKEGTVTFQADIVKQENNKITLQFNIIDTGVGIPPENIANLFNTFERMDKKMHHEIEGTGLGLAIAKGYIDLMGGDIKVQSEYNKGSTFTVILEQDIIDATPLEQDYSYNKLENTGSRISDLKIKGVSVLVVDDNIINLRVAQSIFSHYQLDVETASSGAEAIALCRSKNYGFVFMDQMMPEMDGVEAMKEIRTINPHYADNGKCKIIVLTANAVKGTREDLINQGFDEYLGKPLNIPHLERIFVRYVPKNLISYKETSADGHTEESVSTDFLKDTLTDVDTTMGMNNCGKNLNDYLEILKITYEHGHRQLEELENSLAAGNYDNYVIKIHSIKSTSMNIGAKKLSAEARAQEFEGLDGNYEYLQEHFPSFKERYLQLLDKLKAVLTHYNILEDKTEETHSVDDKSARQILNTIKGHLDAFDFGSIFEILENSQNLAFPEPYQDVIDKLGPLMDDLDVDTINELLEKVL